MPTSPAQSQPQTHRSDQSFSRKIQAEFWVIGAILLLISFASYLSIREFDETVDWAAHSQEILVHLQTVLSDVQDIEIGLLGYVITGKEHFLDAHNNGLDTLSRDRKVLSTALHQDPLYRPEQPLNLAKLEGLIEKKLVLSNAMLTFRKNVPYQPSEIEPYMVESKGLMDAIRVVIDDMQSLEHTRLVERDLQVDEHGRSAVQYFIVGVLIEIIILIWVAWQIRREITQRQQAQEALWRTHDELEFRVQERTRALVDSNECLRELSHRLMNIQETERRQIAHDLHDEIGQSLTAMKLGLKEMENVLKIGPTASLVADSLSTLDGVIRLVRNLALDLRPSLLDEIGLVPALKWYIKRQGDRAGWETEYSAQVADGRLSPEVEIACFRIVQEALTNIVRHAEATHVRVTLAHQGGCLVLDIEDNGKGFNIEQAKNRARSGTSIGLLGMEERARWAGGELTITSSPKTGTRFMVRFPFVEVHPQLMAAEEKMS